MARIKAKKCVLGKPIVQWLPIILPKNLDVGYGPFQLRPDGSRDIRAEWRRFAKITMDINGMSGQLTD